MHSDSLPQQIFRGTIALYGADGFAALQNARVLVVGLGGVGSWAAEALVRTGVGHLIIMDADTIAIHNCNRQLHALSTTVGQGKAAVLGARLKAINPGLDLTVLGEHLQSHNLGRITADYEFTHVIEAIDNIDDKAAVVAHLIRAGKTLITSGGAGGRTDPARLNLASDIAKAHGDQLISHLRTVLRNEYGFPRGGAPMGFPCTYSDEMPIYTREDPAAGRPRFGASMVVTATAGLRLASWIIGQIVTRSSPEADPPIAPVAPSSSST